jgi:hypothetical protein
LPNGHCPGQSDRAGHIDESVTGNYRFVWASARPSFGFFWTKVLDVTELWETLLQLVTILGRLLSELTLLALSWSLLVAWLAWWLWGVSWPRVWRVLAEGAWVPVLLLIIVGALAWSQLAPSNCVCFGSVTVPNFWWQLGSLSLLAAVTLLCGWLQGVFGWTPAELNLESPAATTSDQGHRPQ